MTGSGSGAQFDAMDPAPHVFESRFRVRSYELDGFAHLNHAVFLNWFEQSRFDAFEAGGFPAPEIQARNWGVYVVSLEVQYLKEALLGDELVVRTRVAEVGRSSMVFHQVASHVETPDEPTCEARVRAVFIGVDGRPARIPIEVRTALGAASEE
jgi:YbgC/YbaW family acyl-CoA thioester hydrolase